MAENVYNVSLSGAYEENRRERTIKAVEILRSFLARHGKVTEDKVKISNDLNSVVWGHGMQRPPRSLKVVTTKDEKGNVIADLFREPKAEVKKEPKEKKKARKEAKPEVKKEEEKKVEKVVKSEEKKEEKAEHKKEAKKEVKKEAKSPEKKEAKTKKPAKGRGPE